MFFEEDDKNKLMTAIINTDYEDEDDVWELALKLEKISILLRRNILEYNDGDN